MEIKQCWDPAVTSKGYDLWKIISVFLTISSCGSSGCHPALPSDAECLWRPGPPSSLLLGPEHGCTDLGALGDPSGTGPCKGRLPWGRLGRGWRTQFPSRSGHQRSLYLGGTQTGQGTAQATLCICPSWLLCLHWPWKQSLLGGSEALSAGAHSRRTGATARCTGNQEGRAYKTFLWTLQWFIYLVATTPTEAQAWHLAWGLHMEAAVTALRGFPGTVSPQRLLASSQKSCPEPTSDGRKQSPRVCC